MRTTASALRLALRSADEVNLPAAIGLFKYYVANNKPYPETMKVLFANEPGNSQFNGRLEQVLESLQLKEEGGAYVPVHDTGL